MAETVFTKEDKKNLKTVVEELPKLRLEVESLRETLEILSDKELMQDIEQGKKDIAQGRIYTHKQMLEEMGIDEEEI
ncbi:MAG: hypothetical protein LBC03_01250 [Nitrososphaerota archaeon]|jgi:regulator of replication initiation timing|nr:hypothetical protein [Nitrososphaerota archaeon]